MNVKKIFTGVAIGSIALAGILVIGAIFGIVKFEGGVLNVILSAVTLCVGSVFAINATLLKDGGHKIVSMIGYVITGLSVLLFLLLIWVGGDALFKVAIIIGVSSIFANIIMSNAVKLGKKFLVLQLVEYVVVFAIDMVIVLSTCGVDVLGDETILKVFIAGCILAGVGMVTLAILSKKYSADVKNVETKDTVTISKEEYETLKKKAKLYDDMAKDLKQDNVNDDK